MALRFYVLGTFLISIVPNASGQEDFHWKNSYGTGVGKIPVSHVCPSNKEEDAGLCHEPCRAGYHGAGPVRWGNTPSSYVTCGAGFAKDSKTCAKITAEQVAAVGIFVGTTVVPAAKAARNAEKAAEEGAKGKETFEALRPLLDKFKTTFKNVKTSKQGTMMTNIKKNWDDLSYADQTKIKVALKLVTAGPSTVNDATKDQINPIDLLRDAANIASAFDPSGVLSVAAAYIYPVYGVKY